MCEQQQQGGADQSRHRASGARVVAAGYHRAGTLRGRVACYGAVDGKALDRGLSAPMRQGPGLVGRPIKLVDLLVAGEAVLESVV